MRYSTDSAWYGSHRRFRRLCRLGYAAGNEKLQDGKNSKLRLDAVIFSYQIEAVPEHLKYCPFTNHVPCEMQFSGRPTIPLIELFLRYEADNQVSHVANKKDGHGYASKISD